MLFLQVISPCFLVSLSKTLKAQTFGLENDCEISDLKAHPISHFLG
jgi:hypothetical protein